MQGEREDGGDAQQDDAAGNQTPMFVICKSHMYQPYPVALSLPFPPDNTKSLKP